MWGTLHISIFTVKCSAFSAQSRPAVLPAKPVGDETGPGSAATGGFGPPPATRSPEGKNKLPAARRAGTAPRIQSASDWVTPKPLISAATGSLGPPLRGLRKLTSKRGGRAAGPSAV